MRPMIDLLTHRPMIMARRLFGTRTASSNMDREEDDYRGHAEEVDKSRGIISAEQRRQILQLHRLPDG